MSVPVAVVVPVHDPTVVTLTYNVATLFAANVFAPLMVTPSTAEVLVTVLPSPPGASVMPVLVYSRILLV